MDDVIAKILSLSTEAGVQVPSRLLHPFQANKEIVAWTLEYARGGGELTNLVLESVALHWSGLSMSDDDASVLLTKVRAHLQVCADAPSYAPIQATYLLLSKLADRVGGKSYQHTPDLE